MIPLPNFLACLDNLHAGVAWGGTFVLGVGSIGWILMTMLFSLLDPDAKSDPAFYRKSLKLGFLSLLTAVGTLVFGLYLWSVLTILLIGIIVWLAPRSLKIIFGK